MPELPETIPPVLLVTVTEDGAPVAGVNLVALPLEGQSTNPVGVVTDPAGTGWIRLPEPGRYLLRATRSDGTVFQLEVEAHRLPLDAAPGYDYLQHINMES